MDPESPDFHAEPKSASCSICLELVLDQRGRSIAKLHCGHEFHLDCIGSAFNAKGAMQCPNCRKVEKGRWLYANGHRPSTDFELDGWVTEDVYDLSYSEPPFGIHWCPFRGFMQFASFFEEGESQPNSYNELVANTAFGDHSSVSSNTHACPFMSRHEFPHGMHSASSSTPNSISENGPFHRHPSSMGGRTSADVINSHGSATELQSHQWSPRPSFLFPVSMNATTDQSTSHLGMRLPRNDHSTQPRLGSFMHPHPLVNGSVTHGGSNVAASLAPIGGETRGHTHGHGSHMYQPSVSSTHRNSAFVPVRRPRPRGLTLISSVAASPSAEVGGFYGFSISGSGNRSRQDDESLGRHFDRAYGWGREGYAPLPWIPLEGESQWWSPFNPNLNPQQGLFPQRAAAASAVAAERVPQSRPENASYQQMPSSRMPPFV